jgi:hypothetical protein
VRLGIRAPRDLPIRRGQLSDQTQPSPLEACCPARIA